jgi:hypothetical protein
MHAVLVRSCRDVRTALNELGIDAAPALGTPRPSATA